MQIANINKTILENTKKDISMMWSYSYTEQLALEEAELGEFETEGIWIIMSRACFLIEQEELIIDIEKCAVQNKCAKNIARKFDTLKNHNGYILAENTDIKIKIPRGTFMQFNIGNEKVFINEKDIKVLDENIKTYIFKVTRAEIDDEENMVITAIRCSDNKLCAVFIPELNMEELGI